MRGFFLILIIKNKIIDININNYKLILYIRLFFILKNNWLLINNLLFTYVIIYENNINKKILFLFSRIIYE